MTQKVTTTVTKGLVIGLIMIVIAIAITFAGLPMDTPVRWLIYAVYCIGIIVSINQYGKQINYNSGFGNYFSHGFKISALVTIIMILYTVIFLVAFPEFKEKALDEARKAIEAKKNMSDDQMQQAIQMTRKFFMVFLVGGILIAYLIVGVIASLIGAAVTKKQPHQLQEEHLNQIGS